MKELEQLVNYTQKNYKVGLYIRLSKEDGDKGESMSVTNQRMLLKRYCKDQKLTIVQEYVDDGYSGTNFNRPRFQKMIRDIEKGVINTVITKDLSRLGRDYIETGRYVQKYFPENNIRYIAVLDNVDTEESRGMDDMAPFKSLINDFYAKDISNKIKGAIHERKRQGLFIATTAPYGYDKDPQDNHKLVINEKEAKIVRRIYSLYLQGNGLTKIAKILTDEKVEVPAVSKNISSNKKTALYNCWKQGTISRMLRNPVYVGDMEQLKRQNLNYKSKLRVTVPKEKRIVVKNTHEAIISREDFEMVQTRINKNASFKNTRHDHLFKGLLYCEECGARLMITYSNYHLKKYNEYFYTTYCYTYSRVGAKCTRHSYKLEPLEELLLSYIRAICKAYLKEGTKKEILKEAKNVVKENTFFEVSEEDINKEYEKKISEQDKLISELYKDKVKGIITEDIFVTMSEDFVKEKENLIKEREEKLKECLMDKAEKFDDSELEKTIKAFLKMKRPSKELLGSLIKKITISEDNRISIKFSFEKLNEVTKFKLKETITEEDLRLKVGPSAKCKERKRKTA